MKKFVSVLLTLLMVLAVCPLAAAAETVTWDKSANSFANVEEGDTTVTYLDILLNTRKKADAAGIPAIAEGLFANKGDYTWKLTITDVTDMTPVTVEKSYLPAKYEVVSNGVNEYPAFRFAICVDEDPFVPAINRAYKSVLEIYQGEELLYTTGTSIAQTTCTVEPVLPEAKTVEIAPFADGWENWGGGSNGNATQLLLMITNTADVKIADLWSEKDALDWTLDISTLETDETGTVVATSTRTITGKPSSAYNGGAANEGDWGIIRFETCEMADPNKFIPAKGSTYGVKLTVSKNGVAKFVGESEGFYCPMIPVMYNATTGEVEERDVRSTEGYEDLGVEQINKGFVKLNGKNYYAPDWVGYGKDLASALYLKLGNVFDTELLLAGIESGKYQLEVTLKDTDEKETTYPATLAGYDDTEENPVSIHEINVYLDLEGFTSEPGKLFDATIAVKEGDTVVNTGAVNFISYGYIASDKKTPGGDNTFDAFEGEQIFPAVANEEAPFDVSGKWLVLGTLINVDEFEATAGTTWGYKLYWRKADTQDPWQSADSQLIGVLEGDEGAKIYRLEALEAAKTMEKGSEYEFVVEISENGKTTRWGEMFGTFTEKSAQAFELINGSDKPVDPGHDNDPTGDPVVYLTVAMVVALVAMAIVFKKVRKA